MHYEPDVKSSTNKRAGHKDRSDRTYKNEGKSNRPNLRYNGSGSDFTPRNQSISSNTFSALEKRTAQHLKSFPSEDEDSKLLSRWHRTTNELVMEWTKLWGRGRASHQVTPQQIVQGVSLVDDLMNKLLDVIKREVERAVDKSGVARALVPPSPAVTDPKKRALDTEICCQMIALGWSRCDPKCSPKNAAKRAQVILKRLEEITQLYDCLPERDARGLSFARREIVPTTRLYNHVLSCWSRSLSPDAECCALELFKRMASGNAYTLPDEISYNNILNLYANKGDVEKAEALLRQMEQPSDEYQPLQNQFPRNNDIKPDVFSYSIVINAIKKRFLTNHDMNDPARAEKIVTEMVKKGVMPNEVCFSTVLTMYTEGDRILRGKKNFGRNWKNRGSNEMRNIGWGSENANRALDWMIELFERGDDVQVNSQHFTTVIDAISKSGRGVEGAKKCEQLCDRLISFYEESGADHLRPRPEVRYSLRAGMDDRKLHLLLNSSICFYSNQVLWCCHQCVVKGRRGIFIC
jgi:pentatricopeptide repeat protein